MATEETEMIDVSTGSDIEIGVDPRESAELAGLAYVTDAKPGILRKKWGRGFTYFLPNGEHLKDDDTRARIDALVIPPAWTDVWICVDPNGHIQATGRDAEGRKQYIYHADWERARNEAKFNRIVVFGEALSTIRAQCESDLRRHGLPAGKVVAAVVALLDRTLIRVGNLTYAQRNGSFGLTTLRDRHVDFSGTRCTFEFVGKGGKQHCIELVDARLARVVRRCRDVPGYELFQYYDADGTRCRISSSDVNNYLREATGESFTAKDFRTWGASVQAAVFLYELNPPADDKEAEKHVVEAVKAVAERLGNTAVVTRSYYIHPRVLEGYRDASFRERFEEGLAVDPIDHLDREETALLHFLRA